MSADILPFPPLPTQRFKTIERGRGLGEYEVSGPTKGGYYRLSTVETVELLTLEELNERLNP